MKSRTGHDDSTRAAKDPNPLPAPSRSLSNPFLISVLSLDSRGRIIGVNEAALALFDIPRDVLSGKFFVSFIANESIRDYTVHMEESIRAPDDGLSNLNMNLNLIIGGMKKPVQFSMSRWKYGENIRFLVTIVDLTDIRALERRLQEAAVQWRSLARHAPGVILEVDRHGKIAFASHPRLDGDLAFVDATNIYDVFPHDQAKIRDCLRRVFHEGFLANCEVKGSGDAWYHLRLGPVHRLQGPARDLFNVSTVIVTDVSTERAHDAELQSASHQLRDLSAKLEKVREEERTRIARELHDEFGQALTAMRMELSWIQGRVLNRDEAARGRLQMLIESADAMIDNVRRIVSDLRPPLLDDLGLVAALEWQLQDFEKHSQIRCRFKADKRAFSLNADRATAVFRVVQEALTNVARHARAKNVFVDLQMERGRLTVSIRDDGKGISASKVAAPGSLGLLGMRERLVRLGGELEIQGNPKTGTRIRFQLPLD